MAKPFNNALAYLKADLGYYNTSIPPSLESHLQGLILTAESQIQARGVKLSSGVAADDQFVAAWAAWLFRNKKGDARPAGLTQELRDRQVGNATSPTEVTA